MSHVLERGATMVGMFAALVAALALAGCDGATRALVELRDQGLAPGSFDSLHVRVGDDSGFVGLDVTKPVCAPPGGGNCLPLPLSLLLVPGHSDPAAQVTIECDALAGGAIVASAQKTFRFTPGQTERFVVTFAPPQNSPDLGGRQVDGAVVDSGDSGPSDGSADLAPPGHDGAVDFAHVDLAHSVDQSHPPAVDLFSPDLLSARSPFGGPCTASSGCQSGLSCTRTDGEGNTFPGGGVCTIKCIEDSDCTTVQKKAVCLYTGDISVCMPSCSKSAPCRTGYSCCNYMDSGSIGCDPTDDPYQTGSC